MRQSASTLDTRKCSICLFNLRREERIDNFTVILDSIATLSSGPCKATGHLSGSSVAAVSCVGRLVAPSLTLSRSGAYPMFADGTSVTDGFAAGNASRQCLYVGSADKIQRLLPYSILTPIANSKEDTRGSHFSRKDWSKS